MAITLTATLRNAKADAVDDAVNTGVGTAQLVIRAGTTDLVAFSLPNPAFGAAATGTITLNGVPISANATAAGTADGFQVKNRDGTLLYSGTVTATGGGGDVTVDNTSIANGQEVQLTSHTYTQPAS